MNKQKPDCKKCKYARRNPGTAHLSCHHPDSGCRPGVNGFAELLKGAQTGHEKLNIVGHHHGVRNGWFFWPFDFDPTWLLSCNGFEPVEETTNANETQDHS